MASPRKPLTAPIFGAPPSVLVAEPGDCNNKIDDLSTSWLLHTGYQSTACQSTDFVLLLTTREGHAKDTLTANQTAQRNITTLEATLHQRGQIRPRQIMIPNRAQLEMHTKANDRAFKWSTTAYRRSRLALGQNCESARIV